MRAIRLQLVLAAVVACGALPANAQNLIADAGFATNLSAWTPFGSTAPADGTRAWNGDDVDAVPASGSAALTVQTAGAQVGLSQCVTVTGGTTYEYYSRIKFPTGQSAGNARAIMEVAFYPNADCTAQENRTQGMGAVVGQAYALNDAFWAGIPGNAAPETEGSAVAPAGSGSAQVRIFVEQTSGAAAHTARFDSVVFHDASTVPVSLLQFDVE